MINHLPSHTTIYTDILARNEACLIGTKKQYHIGNIQRIANSPCRVLKSIGAFINFIVSVYPTRGDRVDTYTTGKTD